MHTCQFWDWRPQENYYFRQKTAMNKIKKFCLATVEICYWTQLFVHIVLNINNVHVISFKPGAYFLRMQIRYKFWRHKFVINNSHQLNCAQLLRRIIHSESSAVMTTFVWEVWTKLYSHDSVRHCPWWSHKISGPIFEVWKFWQVCTMFMNKISLFEYGVLKRTMTYWSTEIAVVIIATKLQKHYMALLTAECCACNNHSSKLQECYWPNDQGTNIKCIDMLLKTRFIRNR